MRRRRLLLGAPVAGLALSASLLFGCGGSSGGNGIASRPPQLIASEARTAADGAASVHISGSVVAKGRALSLDLELLTGRGGRGMITESGLSVEILGIGEAVYMKGDEAFDRRIGGAVAVQVLHGKWLKATPTSGYFGAFAALLDPRKLIDTAFAKLGPLATGSTTTVHGQGALMVRSLAGAGVLYVATTGKPFPLELTDGGASGGAIYFDRWNQAVSLVAPNNAINLAQLQTGH
jgi:hypothetical protein